MNAQSQKWYSSCRISAPPLGTIGIATPKGATVSDHLKSHELGRLLELGWEYARDAMFVGDCRTGLLADVNPAAERATGRSREELIGMHQSLLHPEEERLRVQEAYRQAVASEPAVFDGFHLLHKDGQSIPVSISSSVPFDADGRLLIIGIFRDVSDLEERQQRLETKRWALRAYAEAALALSRARSSASLMQSICEAMTHESIFRLAWVGFPDEGPEKLIRMVGMAGPAIAYGESLEVSWAEDRESGRGPTGVAFRTNTVQVLEDTENNEIFEHWREPARQEGLRSSLTVPFQVDESRRGVLAVYSSRPHAFGPVVTEAFTHLAEEIGAGLRALQQAERLEAEREAREKAQSELSAALSAVVGAITTAFEMRDPYTAGHPSVAMIAVAIAREMGWSEESLQALHVACIVHDIGKIAIPVEILTKPGKLSAEEWVLVKKHAEAGYTILKDVPFRWPIAESVRQHHERMDGSGYPRGLKGDEILPGARILAVADIVESVAAARPYRAALGLDVALAEIEKQSGTLLDADVVRICLRLFREKGLVLAGLNDAVSAGEGLR